MSERYQEALAHVRNLDVHLARPILVEILHENPSHFDALKSLYNLDKLNPASDEFLESTNQLISFDYTNIKYDQDILGLINEFVPSQIGEKSLSLDAYFALLHRQLRNDQLKTSADHIKYVKQNHATHPKLPKLLLHWALALLQRDKIQAAVREFNYLANYYGETEYGVAASQHLKPFRIKR